METHITPTAEQRLDIYVRALFYVLQNQVYSRCICSAIYKAQVELVYCDEYGTPRWNTSISNPNGNDMRHNFPELFKRKPKKAEHNRPWWLLPTDKPNKRRVGVINNMIAEVQAEIENKLDVLN